LYLVREDDIKAWRDYNDLKFIQCACKFTDTCTTCDNEETRSKRLEIKNLIHDLKKTNPFIEGNIFKSVENVNLDTVIAYKKDGVKHRERARSTSKIQKKATIKGKNELKSCLVELY
jgi:tRNA 2-thiocytidine biosynthesis protein TtcA